MRKYRKEDPSIVQPAETQARPKLSSYAKTSTRFQLKDHPIYPGHSGQEPMGGGRRRIQNIHIKSIDAGEYRHPGLLAGKSHAHSTT